ncbi:MAG: TadE family protein [Planctomycetota bacterium]
MSTGHAVRRPSFRRGAAAVEFAVVAPLLFTFVFASIEFERVIMAVNALEEAARGGARVAVLEDATTTRIEAAVEDVLNIAGVDGYTVTVTPTAFRSVDSWNPITVTVTATFADIAWLPTPSFLADIPFTAACTLPKEAT